MKADLCHLTLQKPPEFLFKAVTVEESDQVFRSGLNRRKMPFIELFTSEREARSKMKGVSSAFVVLSRVMADDGYNFCLAETGEWVTDEVPPRYLRIC